MVDWTAVDDGLTLTFDQDIVIQGVSSHVRVSEQHLLVDRRCGG